MDRGGWWVAVHGVTEFCNSRTAMLFLSPQWFSQWSSWGRASISWELARKARGPSSPLGTLRKLAKDQEYWSLISSLSPPLVGRDGRG